MSQYHYKLVYTPYQCRSRTVAPYGPGGWGVKWGDEVPESLCIHFYTIHTHKTKGFFGIGAREFPVYHWANEQQMDVHRHDNEEEDKWLSRVELIAKNTVCNLERMSRFARLIEKKNKWRESLTNG